MEENFQELLVQRKPAGYAAPVKALSIVLLVLFIGAGVFINPIVLIAAVVLGIVMYLQFPKLSVEFEYLLVNNELQVDIIYSKEKRKELKRLDLRQAALMAPEGSDELRSYERLKTIDYSAADPTEKPYVLVAGDGSGQEKYMLQLSGDMLKEIKTILGHRFKQW